MIKGLVNKIIPFSAVDGPGNRTAVFLQGCNFNCLYCHNPETINTCSSCGLCIESCPENCLTIEFAGIHWNSKACRQCDNCLKTCKSSSSPKTMRMSADEVMQEIAKTKNFISGITISGGECMLQKEFVIELCNEVKKLGLTAFIDSNGSIPFFDDEELIEAIDMVMLDVKAYDGQEHLMLTGKDNELVIKNMEYLASIGKLYEVRTVIVPGVLNNEKSVDMISKKISGLNPNIRYKLIKFRPMGVRTYMLESSVPTDEAMEKLKAVAEENGCRAVMVV